MRDSRRYRSAGLLWIALVAASCGKTAPRVTPTMPPAWPAAYTAAIADALNPEPAEIATDLVAIVPGNPMLTWRTFPDGDRVLMATLVGDPSFYPSTPGEAYNTRSHDVWLTAVPEIKRACTQPAFARGNLAERLRQAIGLTPDDKVTAFVELWVLPEQMFRPAADSDITRASAGLTMPADTEAWYRSWFNALRAKQYHQSTTPANNAYPWTQLGYTYDWGSDRHQGFSEFVVKRQATVYVNSITPFTVYCGAPH